MVAMVGPWQDECGGAGLVEAEHRRGFAAFSFLKTKGAGRLARSGFR